MSTYAPLHHFHSSVIHSISLHAFTHSSTTSTQAKTLKQKLIKKITEQGSERNEEKQLKQLISFACDEEVLLPVILGDGKMCEWKRLEVTSGGGKINLQPLHFMKNKLKKLLRHEMARKSSLSAFECN